MRRSRLLALACLLLLAGGASPAATAAILDVGEVAVDAAGELRIGIDGFGRRSVDGSADGPHTGITVGVNAGSSGEYVLTNGASAASSGSLVVGDQGVGVVEVSGGSTLSSGAATLHERAESSLIPATVTVSGAGSSWSNQGLLSINPNKEVGSARLHIVDGGSLSTDGTQSRGITGGLGGPEIVIDGTGSRWINFDSLTIIDHVDYSILDGGSAVDRGVSIASDFVESHFLVRGDGSTWWTGALELRSRGRTFEVEDGGRVVSDQVVLTTQTSQVVSVNGAGSAWEIAGALAVAGSGAGGSSFMEITRGAAVSSRSGSIGSPGVCCDTGVTVRDPGSSWTVDGDVRVATGDPLFTDGTLNIREGGRVRNEDASLEFGGEAVVEGAGSRWDSAGALFVGGGEEGQTGLGRLRIADAGTVAVADAVTAWEPGTIAMEDGFLAAGSVRLLGGTLSGEGEVAAGDVLNDGVVDPHGLLRLHDDYAQAEQGRLDITLGGTAPVTGHDVLAVLGTSFLDGELRVELADGFLPAAGDRFLVLAYGERVGRFDAITGPALAGDLALRPLYTSTGLVLRAVPEPATALLLAAGLAALALRRRSRPPTPLP